MEELEVKRYREFLRKRGYVLHKQGNAFYVNPITDDNGEPGPDENFRWMDLSGVHDLCAEIYGDEHS